MTASTPSQKIIERVKKLLELSHSTNEHEAAQAAERAAALMSEHAVTEAMIQATGDDDVLNAHIKERIVEGDLPEHTSRKVAWRDVLATNVARSFSCEPFFWNSNVHVVGRESNVATWRYTMTYLIAEVDRLADEAWLREGPDLIKVGATPKAWKGAFRLGAADTVANRLYNERKAREEREKAMALEQARALPGREQVRALPADALAVHDEEGPIQPSQALVIADKALAVLQADRQEVKEAFTKRTTGPGWKKTSGLGNSTRGRSGYEAGREAGASIQLNKARGALKA